MRVQPILGEYLVRQVLRALDLTPALGVLAQAVEGLRHVPFGAGVEEREFVSGFETFLEVGVYPDFPAGHVKNEGGSAGVVYVD